MTTQTEYYVNKEPLFSLPALLAFLAVHALLACLLLARQADAGLDVRMSTHAVTKHGADATAIRKCLDNNNGSGNIWAFTSHRRKDHFIRTCQLPDGRHGIQIIQKIADGFKERTAFVVKDGTAFQLKEYITARAVYIGTLIP